MSDGSSVVAGVKRKMRKGTVSCVECRRRKIKCTFIHGDARCANCMARGTQCVDQRDVEGVEDYSADDSAVSLRDRVASLERQLADVVQTINGELQRVPPVEQSRISTDGSDIGPPLDDTVAKPAFKPAVSDIFGAWNYQRSQAGDNVRILLSDRKASEVCKTLRSCLPTLDALLEGLPKYRSWWSHYQQQVRPEGENMEDVSAFVSRTYSSRSPGDLGCLIAAHARSLWKGSYHLYSYVESLVISDAVYSSTIEGVECVILLAQTFMDIGQPRRAWLMYQRGVALARVMGLDQHFEKNDKKAALWWSIYLGDRLCSMVLGLPSNVNDFHYGLQVGERFLPETSTRRLFMIRCAVVAGRIMERCTRKGALFSVSLSHADDLEAELNDLATSTPQEWWSLPKQFPETAAEIDELRERLIQQVYYFHVRMHIDLSHLGEAPGSPNWRSKMNCMEAARQLLRRAILLTQHIGTYRLFECKTNDFIGFIAASVLTIGLFSLGNDVDQSLVSEDQFLIDTMKNSFQHEEMLRKCQIAGQCGRTLELLTKPRANEENPKDRIVIPYFGTVVKKVLPAQASGAPAGGNAHLPSPSGAPNAIATQDTPVDLGFGGSNTGWLSSHQQSTPSQTFSLEEQTVSGLFSDNLYWELENSSGFMSGDFNPLLDPAMYDLGQDWNMFSNFDDSPMSQAL